MSVCCVHDKRTELSLALERLAEAGLKVTRQRTAILKTILSEDEPLTADEIHRLVTEKQTNIIIDRATVYRCLTKFVEADLVASFFLDASTTRYEFISSKGARHHHHILCRLCQKIESVEFCFADKNEAALQKLGFSNISHKLEFYGVCKPCSEKPSRSLGESRK